jgi:mannosyl-3-phosphoglycerate phosphatase
LIRIVIMTDLDGCLLDPETYDPGMALEFLPRLVDMGIEIIFNSSKTRLEQLYYRRIWNLNNIFAVENGAAVYIPIGKDYKTIINGVDKKIIDEKLEELKKSTRGKLLWLDDMSPIDFSYITGLPVDLAVFALEREYSTLFHPVKINRSELEKIIESIETRGFKVFTGSGRVYVISGNHDKGVAAKQIIEYLSRRRRIISIGVGDGLNDYPMLTVTDYSIVLGNRDLYNKLLLVKPSERIVYMDYRGPKAWIEAITRLIDELKK